LSNIQDVGRGEKQKRVALMDHSLIC